MRTPAQLRTDRTRRLHYFHFVTSMKWDDDLLLLNAPPIRGQAQLAAYALHLSAGNSINCRAIKLATIKEYIHSVSIFLASFTGIDFRKDNNTDSSFGHLLTPVFDDLKRYETVPDRREPYTPEMHAEAERIAQPIRIHNSCSLVPALTDGFAMASKAGFRLTEWAQPNGITNPLQPHLNHLQPPSNRTRAICPADLRIETNTYQRFTGMDILSVPLSSIRKLWVIFRTQKNGQNGEERLFTLHPNGGTCFVTATYSCLKRFQTLNNLLPALTEHSPLCCYWNPTTSSVELITADDVEDYMRAIAATVYNLHPIRNKKELQKWSSHSLRVGACVVLHSMGFSALDIQWLLRWRSNAFMAYLRNLAGLADRHNEAHDRAQGMPHLF